MCCGKATLLEQGVEVRDDGKVLLRRKHSFVVFLLFLFVLELLRWIKAAHTVSFFLHS